MGRVYACIDLKSFYASVECVERGLNPLTTNLVVADSARTVKTICLAVSPSLKSYGLKGRARLYEVEQKVREINQIRKKKINDFTTCSYNNEIVKMNPYAKLDYIVAKPRMKKYMQYSALIYNIYLKYLASDDIYVYSVDEVFCDLTNYLKYQKISAYEMVEKILLDILQTTNITATAGIGTNLYLAKVAMDILAKKTKPNPRNVRIAYLDEMTYRKLLWHHTPITDFWRVGKGYAERLKEKGIYTMGDIALSSLENEEILYQMFGVNSEILIDHAWGYEPCTIKDIKNYQPDTSSLSRGQVLHEPYDSRKAKIIVLEMTDLLSFDLVEHQLVCKELMLTIGYDISNLDNNYHGAIQKDHYGRFLPHESHGKIELNTYTSSAKIMVQQIEKLYEKIVNQKLLIRRITIAAIDVIENGEMLNNACQLSLFDNHLRQREDNQKELRMEEAVIEIKKKYGKNAILRGMNLLDGATTIERNREIGGHHE